MSAARVTLSATLLMGLASLTWSREAGAEKEVGLGAAYDVRVPVGGMRRLVPNTSFSGLQAKWDYYPLDALSTGFQVQYNLFQRPPVTATLTQPDGAITGTTFRYASFWSVMATARYYLFERSALRPYAELGLGVTSASSVAVVSDLMERDLSTALIVQPSAGLLWRLSPRRTPTASHPDEGTIGPRKPHDGLFGLTASATYAFTFADVIGASNVAYAGFQIGIYAKP